ncbi:MAG: hypothetical protein M3395_02980 [Chloroflexota bacterium]|nr:hypothetical protein [Chloroflexota bacterium]
MDRRLEGMPAVVVITAASFALFGGLLLFIAASDVMTRGSSDGMLIAYGFTTLVGVASTAISLGVAAGRWSARILGILGATLVMLAAAAGMLFTALMAGSVGIGWDDRLFLEPFSFLLLFAAAAAGCVVALVRSRAWFASRPRRGDHGTSVPAVIAGGVLFLVGVPLAPWGPVMMEEGLGHGTDSGGVREIMTGLGVVILVIGVLHVIAALLVWAHRDRGRSLGIGIGGMGTLLGAATLVGGAPNLTLLLVPVPHLVVLIGLLVGRSHFTRR